MESKEEAIIVRSFTEQQGKYHSVKCAESYFNGYINALKDCNAPQYKIDEAEKTRELMVKQYSK